MTLQLAPVSLSLLAISALAGLVRASEATVHNEQCGWPATSVLGHHPRHTCPRALDDNVGFGPLSWAPWTHRPYCSDAQYCVFTNSAFRGNHGISVITTPEIVASSPSLLLKLTGTTEAQNAAAAAPVTPYEVRDIPGKGKGLFATRRIPRGEIFLEDYPSVLADVEFPSRVRRSEGQVLLLRAMEQLANPEEVFSLARSSTTGTPVQEDVMRTNSFAITVGERSRMALFPKISVSIQDCSRYFGGE